MTDYMIKLSSGNKTLEISPNSECRLVEGGLSGFDCTGFDVKLNPYAILQGGYVQKRRFAERELGLTFEISVLGEAANSVRRRIVSMMNPREDLELEIHMYGVNRRISVIPYDEAQFFRATFADYTEVSLKFISPAVFFSDTKSEVIRFRDAVPIFTFPLNFMSGAGTVSGVYRVSDKTTAKNDGDGECGIVAKIRASGGNVINPGIKCGDNFVKCPITLYDGDELIIDTRARMKNIYLNGERFFSFERDSVFFDLPMGECQMSVLCTSGGEYIEAEVEYTPIYFGL